MQNVIEYFQERRSTLPPKMRGALDRCARYQVDKRSGLYLPGKRSMVENNIAFMFPMQVQYTDGGALTASTTATSLLHATAKPTIIANTMRVGQMYLLMAAGRVSNIVTTPGTLTLDVRLGAVIAANGGAMALNTTAKTNVPWYLMWMLTCRAIGSGTGANLMHQGTWTSESVIGAAAPAAGGAGTHMLPNAAPAVGTGFDSSANQTVDLFGTWSLNNANSIQTHQFAFIEVN